MLFSSASKKPDRLLDAPAPHVRPGQLSRAIAQAFAGSAVFAACALAPALANPSGESVTQGRATFDRSKPGVLNVSTQTANTAIDWQQFSIERGESTHFQQPNAASTVVNRVVQPNPSRILGALTSNGQVVLVNPWGIAFGAGAVVDTAGFAASTMDLDASAPDRNGAITVEGRIRSRTGDLVLLSPDIRVAPDGRLEADQGTIVLAAAGPQWASATRLKIGDRELDNVVFELQPDKLARALEEVSTGGAALFTGSLQHSGVIVAKEASRNQAGKVVLLGARIERPGRIEHDNGLHVNGAVAAAPAPPPDSPAPPAPSPSPSAPSSSPPTPSPGAETPSQSQPPAPGFGLLPPQRGPRPAPSPANQPTAAPASSVDRMTRAAGGAATRAEMQAVVAELDGETVGAGGLGQDRDDRPAGRRDRDAPADPETCGPESQ